MEQVDVSSTTMFTLVKITLHWCWYVRVILTLEPSSLYGSMEQCCAAPASDSLCSLYILWLQRCQSEVMAGKFETVEQVKEYEQQWNLLYETSASDLREKVCRCMCISVQNDRHMVALFLCIYLQLKKHSQLLNLEVFKQLRLAKGATFSLAFLLIIKESLPPILLPHFSYT